METVTPPLGERIRLPAAIGLGVGLIRFVLEFVAPGLSMYFGVYYVMPVVIAAIGLRGSWGPIRWPSLLLSMFVLCLIVWGIANSLSYTTAQFLEWHHGRFAEGRAAPIAASALGKIGVGLLQGALTSLAGTAWCTVIGTLLIWLPARLRRKERAPM
ncbi:MAG TPA: hypothetical protein VFD82_12435 [Planctomycetota bacterium]|nr:hypothetical protein [Planctomycetota bacterium]